MPRKMKALVKKADGGCAKSALDLFHMIRDFDESRVWLQKAAALGDAWAQFREGQFIQSFATQDKGLSFLEREKEYQDAIVLLRKSADQGHGQAYNILAHAYYRGYGVEQDKVKSHEYDLEGSKRGYYFSSHSVANNYLQGAIATDKGDAGRDVIVAERFYRLAIQQGGAEAREAKDALKKGRRGAAQGNLRLARGAVRVSNEAGREETVRLRTASRARRRPSIRPGLPDVSRILQGALAIQPHRALLLARELRFRRQLAPRSRDVQSFHLEHVPVLRRRQRPTGGTSPPRVALVRVVRERRRDEDVYAVSRPAVLRPTVPAVRVEPAAAPTGGSIFPPIHFSLLGRIVVAAQDVVSENDDAGPGAGCLRRLR